MISYFLPNFVFFVTIIRLFVYKYVIFFAQITDLFFDYYHFIFFFYLGLHSNFSHKWKCCLLCLNVLIFFYNDSLLYLKLSFPCSGFILEREQLKPALSVTFFSKHFAFLIIIIVEDCNEIYQHFLQLKMCLSYWFCHYIFVLNWWTLCFLFVCWV